MAAERKPPQPMESRDERITVRYTSTERLRLEANARANGDELSRYIRKCSLMGDSMAQAIPALKGTGA